MRARRCAWVGMLGTVLLLLGCSLEREMTEKDFVRISLDLYYEGRAAEVAGDLAGARDLYLRSLRIAPRPIVYYQLGMLEYQEKRYDAAVEQMKKALALSPNFTQASEMIKRIEAGQELLSSPEARPRLATELPVRVPAPPAAAYVSSRPATPEGEIVESRTTAPPAGLREETPPSVALPAVGESTSVAAPDTDENLAGGLLLLHQGKYGEAETWFKERLPRDPGNANLHFYLGNALFQQARYNEAYRAYLRALQIDPDMARAYVNLGFCQEILGTSLEAERSYLRAVELAHHPDALYNLGLLYQKRGMFRESIRYLEAYLAAVPAGPSADEARRQILLMRRER